jgi:6-phosphogluconolactonase (cycloisomerase 2 family)
MGAPGLAAPARWAALVAAVTALSATSCVSIEPPDGAYLCATEGQECPTGYHCAADMTCRRSSTTVGEVSSATSRIEIAPAQVVAGAGRATIKVTLSDADGAPVAGQSVALSATGSGNDLVQPAGPTDASGAAVGTLASTVAETKTVTAAAAGIRIAADVTFVPGPVARLCVTNAAANTTTSYPASANGPTAPLAAGSLSGTAAALNVPYGIFADLTNGELFVANLGGNSVNVYNLGDGGATAPKRQITGLGHPAGVWVDASHDQLVIANNSPASIQVYARTASGASGSAGAIVVQSITSVAVSGLSSQVNSVQAPEGVFADGNQIIVANSVNSSVAMFARNANGAVQPTKFLFGSVTGLNGPAAVVLDAPHNELLVVNQNTPSVTVYDTTMLAAGVDNLAAKRTLTGNLTGLAQPAALALSSAADEIYVTNYNAGASSTITIYPRTASGNFDVGTFPGRSIGGGGTMLSGTWGISLCK